MTELLVKNSKIAKSNDSAHEVYNFGIPAYQAKSGFKTCPMAGICAKGCYAQMGSYVYPTVINAYEWRLEQTLKPEFADLMSATIETKLKTAKRRNKTLVIRIHDSGDFYNLEYALKWFKIMVKYPQVLFYAYTKQVILFKKLQDKPSNFCITYSEGGLADSKIDTNVDRHSRVFSSHDELLASGYADATENDLIAAIGVNHKIGLVYHGYKSKGWTTNKEIKNVA